MNKKIVICDDDEDILNLVKDILEDLGYDVLILHDSEDIYKKIINFNPDLILLDLSMPVLGGETICNELKRNPSTKKIPIVIFSASKHIITSSINCQVEGYLSKPFEIKDLEKTIKKFI